MASHKNISSSRLLTVAHLGIEGNFNNANLIEITNGRQ